MDYTYAAENALADLDEVAHHNATRRNIEDDELQAHLTEHGGSSSIRELNLNERSRSWLAQGIKSK